MAERRPLMIEAGRHDTARLLEEWRWLVPTTDTPLFVSAFGDWVFGKPDESLWVFSVLDGGYARVADGAEEYNGLIRSAEWLDETFVAGGLDVAAGHDLVPGKDECLG